MFISWRLLQIGTLSAMLASCAASQPRPADRPVAAPPSALPVTTQDTAESPASADPSLDVRGYALALARERQLPSEQLLNILNSATYNPTVAKLIAPAVAGRKVVRSWTVYRSRVVEPVRVTWGNTFWNQNADLLDAAAQRYGVPQEVIVAIVGVETNYARNMGSFSVLDALYTLAFQYPDSSKPERQRMFRNQLSDFLTLVMAGKLDLGAQGSFAGAIGMAQFMPGSIKSYAVDGDGDGVIDLTQSTADAIMSIGNFLAEHGWVRGLPPFAPVALPANPAALVDGGLTPKLSWPQLDAAGAQASRPINGADWQAYPLGVINLPDDQYGTVQYRTATPSFFAITHYNRSYFYAASVADLASALADSRGKR